MISRVEVFNVPTGLVVRRIVEFPSALAKGVYRFSVQDPSALPTEVSNFGELAKEAVAGADVGGVAYGEPGLYIGTMEDVKSGDRYSAAIAMVQEENLMGVSLAVSALKFESTQAYFLRGEVRTDLLFSSDLEPGTVVAFRGIRVSGKV